MLRPHMSQQCPEIEESYETSDPIWKMRIEKNNDTEYKNWKGALEDENFHTEPV